MTSAQQQRWQWLWPPVGNLESAKHATRQAFWAAVFRATATLLFTILGVSGVQLLVGYPFDLSALIDATLFGAIAYGLWNMSRLAAVAGLALYVFERIDMWAQVGPKNPVMALIIVLAFLSGVRGTFAYCKFVARQKDTVAVTPPS